LLLAKIKNKKRIRCKTKTILIERVNDPLVKREDFSQRVNLKFPNFEQTRLLHTPTIKKLASTLDMTELALEDHSIESL